MLLPTASTRRESSRFQCMQGNSLRLILGWCPLNFKRSSKFPRPSATLSSSAPTCIYPYISQLIGSAAQLQAQWEHFPNKCWGHPVPPLPQGYWSFLDSLSTLPLGKRDTFALSPSPSAPWGYLQGIHTHNGSPLHPPLFLQNFKICREKRTDCKTRQSGDWLPPLVLRL